MITVKKWADLSPEERREERFNRWLSPPEVKFSSPEAEKAYKERVMRFIKVIKLEEPDRVPVILHSGFYPAHYAGGTLKKVMYDYDELRRAWLKFLNEFDMDTYIGPNLVFPGKVLDTIDYKLHYWPGHGLPDNISTYQYIEGEYMKPEEYDDLIRNPADFMLRTFLPRSVGAFAAFRKLAPITPFVGIPVFFITQFGDPEVRAAVQTLLDAALEGMKWEAAVKDINQAIQEAGVPIIRGSMSSAPFDLIGDTLRGTKGIMLDMYRRPEKLQEAMERIIPIAIDSAIRGTDVSGCPVVFMPLHKGPAGFMSGKQFETFYWPTLRRVMMGLIEEGLVPFPFAEGDYMPRLEIIKDVPKGKVIWYFEAMDMAKAKKVLGNRACIVGNLPASILCTGTPREVKEGCRRLIEICAPGGGYILTGAANINECNPQNLRAMMEAAKEYGVYK
jgi:uroporphyrinogen-III decarboxylase